MRISRHRHRRPNIQQRQRIRANNLINVPEVRVIDENGKHIGVMSIGTAIAQARAMDKDLVEINPSTNPPVCKIMELGQYKYQMEKQEKLNRAKQKEVAIKGIHLSPRIGAHDLSIRKEQAGLFLSKGNMVRIEIQLRGRERGHADIAHNVMRQFIASLQETHAIKMEQPVTQQGPRILAIISPTIEKQKTRDDTHDIDEE